MRKDCVSALPGMGVIMGKASVFWGWKGASLYLLVSGQSNRCSAALISTSGRVMVRFVAQGVGARWLRQRYTKRRT